MEDFIWGVSFGFFMGATVALFGTTENWRTDTVDRGLAIYCPQNGQWAWVGECGE